MTDDGLNLNATQLTYLSQYIMLRQEKVNAQNISKIIWTQYYAQKIDLKEARSLSCKINSKQLSNEAYLKKIYAKFGLAATAVDVLADCINIAQNDSYSDQKKGQEITKKIAGNAAGTAVGAKLAKYIPKLIKIMRSCNLITIIGGFALDVVLSYFIGQTTDDVTEALIQKVFDYLG